MLGHDGLLELGLEIYIMALKSTNDAFKIPLLKDLVMFTFCCRVYSLGMHLPGPQIAEEQ